MAITGINDIATGLASGQFRNTFKVLTAPKGAGAFESSWLGTGIPGAGTGSALFSAAAQVFICTGTVLGAQTITNAQTQNYLTQLQMNSNQPGVLILVDRLWSCSGLGITGGIYSVTTPGSLPARITDGGIGAEIWVEQFIAAGAASGNLTANYKNTNSGTSAGTLVGVVSAPVIGQMQQVPLQAGDLGVSQLTSVQITATWTSGSFGITILKRIVQIEIVAANIGKTLDWALLGLPKIPNDACLMWIFLANNASAPTITGNITFIDK